MTKEPMKQFANDVEMVGKNIKEVFKSPSLGIWRKHVIRYSEFLVKWAKDFKEEIENDDTLRKKMLTFATKQRKWLDQLKKSAWKKNLFETLARDDGKWWCKSLCKLIQERKLMDRGYCQC